MLVHVRTPHTDFTIDGVFPSELLVRINEMFSLDCLDSNEGLKDSIYLKAQDMDWYKKAESLESLGGNLRFYRVRKGLTQAQLSKETGISKPLISMMEKDKVSISKQNALVLSRFFNVPLGQFIR